MPGSTLFRYRQRLAGSWYADRLSVGLGAYGVIQPGPKRPTTVVFPDAMAGGDGQDEWSSRGFASTNPPSGRRQGSTVEQSHSGRHDYPWRRITTLDPGQSFVSARAIAQRRVLAVGDLDRLASHLSDATVMIDLKGPTVVPGLNDSHLHIVRGGLTYNMDRVGTGFRRSPKRCACCAGRRNGQRRRSGCSWSGDGPSFRSRSAASQASMRSTRWRPTPRVDLASLFQGSVEQGCAPLARLHPQTPDPPGGVIERDGRGEPIGLLIAAPSSVILNAAVATRRFSTTRPNSTRRGSSCGSSIGSACCPPACQSVEAVTPPGSRRTTLGYPCTGW